MAKILIIEDEEITAFALEEFISSLGYEVQASVNNANSARESIKNEKPDLIISDVSIKGSVSGDELSFELYTKYKIPIIFLTAHYDETIIQYAKLANVQSYIIKPFKDNELKAAIELALHRNHQETTCSVRKRLKIDSYHFDLEEEKLYEGEEEVSLGKKSLILLKILLKHKNQIVSYETLISQIYEDSSSTNIDKLRQMVKRLREKLDLQSIKSVKRMGYVLRD